MSLHIVNTETICQMHKTFFKLVVIIFDALKSMQTQKNCFNTFHLVIVVATLLRDQTAMLRYVFFYILSVFFSLNRSVKLCNARH